MGSSRGPGAARKRDSGGRRRQIASAAEEACGSLPPPPQVFIKTPTLHIQAGSREALPHNKRTAVSWPRRDREGLRLHRGAFSHGGNRSYGVRVYPHRTGYYRRRGLRPRLGSSGNIEQGGGEKRMNSH